MTGGSGKKALTDFCKPIYNPSRASGAMTGVSALMKYVMINELMQRLFSIYRRQSLYSL